MHDFVTWAPRENPIRLTVYEPSGYERASAQPKSFPDSLADFLASKKTSLPYLIPPTNPFPAAKTAPASWVFESLAAVNIFNPDATALAAMSFPVLYQISSGFLASQLSAYVFENNLCLIKY